MIITDVDTLIYDDVFVIDSLSSSETIALVISKDDLMTIKDALKDDAKKVINVLKNVLYELLSVYEVHGHFFMDRGLFFTDRGLLVKRRRSFDGNFLFILV